MPMCFSMWERLRMGEHGGRQLVPRQLKQMWLTAGASLHKLSCSRGMKASLQMSYPTLTIWLSACPQGKSGMSWSAHCFLQHPTPHTGVGTWATYKDGSWSECCPPCHSMLASLMETLCAWPGACSLRVTFWPMTPPAMKWSGFSCEAWLRNSPKQRRPPPGS